MLGLADDPPGPVPGAGGVLELAEEPLLALGRLKLLGGLVHRIGQQPLQNAVSGQADDVLYIVPIAPTQQFPTAEAAVGTKDDLDLRPHPPQPIYQQPQDRPAVPGGVDLGRPQVRGQQLIPAEDVQRQVAVVAIVAVEEAAFLHAVQPGVGGIEVQDQFRRRRLV